VSSAEYVLIDVGYVGNYVEYVLIEVGDHRTENKKGDFYIICIFHLNPLQKTLKYQD
jgi:hypothetical protein